MSLQLPKTTIEYVKPKAHQANDISKSNANKTDSNNITKNRSKLLNSINLTLNQ